MSDLAASRGHAAVLCCPSYAKLCSADGVTSSGLLLLLLLCEGWPAAGLSAVLRSVCLLVRCHCLATTCACGHHPTATATRSSAPDSTCRCPPLPLPQTPRCVRSCGASC